MLLIDFIRHGETDWPGYLLGRTDRPLSQEGWHQFERQTVGRDWSVVVTSPLRRARDPAKKLARQRGLDIAIDPDWSELDFGAWDGQPIADLTTDPAVTDALAEFYRSADAPGPPNGESWHALQVRTSRALGRLLQRKDAQTALVVAHAGPIRAVLSLACAIPFQSVWALKIDYGARVTLRVEANEQAQIWGEIVEIVQA